MQGLFPQGLTGIEAQLWLWLLAMIRPGAAFLAAPVFGAPYVPVQLRLIVSLAVGIPAAAAVPFAMPDGGLATIAGGMMVVGEVLAGLAIGFAVQIGFSAALLAGETIGNAMGLGFAGMIDPASGTSSPALGQLLSILGTFLFLAMGGHLILAAIVFESYKALPPGQGWLGAESMRGLVMFGGTVFAAGLAIALPVGFALILGMLARSAPSLNLFAVGLPATILAGIVLLAVGAPTMADALTASLQRGLDFAGELAAGR
jgi:flagellar biosynthetic protein FliR